MYLTYLSAMDAGPVDSFHICNAFFLALAMPFDMQDR